MTPNKIFLRELSDKIYSFYAGSNLDMSTYEEVFNKMIDEAGWEFKHVFELEDEAYATLEFPSQSCVAPAFYDALNGLMTANRVYNICSQYLK